MKFTKEDIELIEKFIEIKNKGYYVDGGQLTTVYNRVLERNVNSTSCGSCLRQRVNELESALNHYKAQEALKNNNPNNSPSEENKTTVDNIPEQPVEEKKRVGRPKRK